MPEIVRFGIVGCGVISKWHADAIESISGAKLVGATDLNKDALKEFTDNYNIKGYNTLEDMLACDEIDVVSICTPSGLHASQAIQAANAGVNVIVEKPMAITMTEVDAVIEASERNNVKLAVISQLRFSDSIIKVKDAIDNQKLGNIVLCDLYMKYHRSPEYYASSNWRGTWKIDGGGALMNQGIHGIDILQYVMGPVKSVFGQVRTLTHDIEVEDTACAILEFKNGALGTIEGTTSVYPGYSRRLEIHGDQGSIILEEDNIVEWYTIDGEDAGISKDKSVEFSSSSDPAAIGQQGHINQITDFLNAIKDDRRPLVDQYEGKKPVEIILGIYESSRTDQKIIIN